jgi:cell division septal protein FtsQ
MQALQGSLVIDLRSLGHWARTIITAVALTMACLFLGKGISTYGQFIGIFDLKRIEIRGNNILTRAEVIRNMALPLTGTVFEVDLSAVQARIESMNYVHGVRVGRKLPNTLFVDIVENEPLAYVAAPEYFVLTDEERALPLPGGMFDLELPTISGVDTALIALTKETIQDHSQLSRAWKILHHIRHSFPQIYDELSELVINPTGEVTLYLTEISTAVRLGDSDLEMRIALLDSFLHTVQGKRRLMDYSYIDLRYARQVIVRERARS